MRHFIRVFLLSFICTPMVMAQAPQSVQETPIAPSQPTATMQTQPAGQPIQSTPLAEPQIDPSQQLQKLLGHKNNQQSLGQVMVVGTLLGCTQKKVGQPATQALYQELQTTGKTVEGYCKQGNPAAAKALVLSTIDAKHNDPVAKSALSCYDQQTTSIAAMGGPEMADNLAHYASWLRDPALAHSQIKESDICKHSVNKGS